MSDINELRNRAQEIGKKGMVLRFGVVGFGSLLIAVNFLRFLVSHGFSVAALASEEFAGMMLQTVIGAPLMGAVWGWGVWKLLTWE